MGSRGIRGGTSNSESRLAGQSALPQTDATAPLGRLRIKGEERLIRSSLARRPGTFESGRSGGINQPVRIGGSNQAVRSRTAVSGQEAQPATGAHGSAPSKVAPPEEPPGGLQRDRRPGDPHLGDRPRPERHRPISGAKPPASSPFSPLTVHTQAHFSARRLALDPPYAGNATFQHRRHRAGISSRSTSPSACRLITSSTPGRSPSMWAISYESCGMASRPRASTSMR
jgi:hypothetical protein